MNEKLRVAILNKFSIISCFIINFQFFISLLGYFLTSKSIIKISDINSKANREICAVINNLIGNSMSKVKRKPECYDAYHMFKVKHGNQLLSFFYLYNVNFKRIAKNVFLLLNLNKCLLRNTLE